MVISTVASGVYSPGHDGTRVSQSAGWLVVEMLNSAPILPVPGCSFTVLVHTREAATRNMEKVQVIKVRPVTPHAVLEVNAVHLC